MGNNNQSVPPMESRRIVTLEILLDRRVWTMLLLGFSAGLPLLLIFGTLSLWLREAGVERGVVTMFSWAALGYSFKFVWAPLVDRLPLPFLTARLGKRRSWLLFAQGMIVVAMWWMSSIDPAQGDASLRWLALAAVVLGFSSATQDIVIDAFRIESAEPRMQALLSSTYIAGYRIAMLVAGAGALLLAEGLGSLANDYNHDAWRITYRVMAACMLVGIVTTLRVSEPARETTPDTVHGQNPRLLLLFVACVFGFVGCYIVTADWAQTARSWLVDGLGNSALAGTLVETVRLSAAVLVAWLVAQVLAMTRLVPLEVATAAYMAPLREFFVRHGRHTAWLILGIIGLYRVSDIVLGVIANVFYYDLGFSKSDVAVVAKSFGLAMTILGGFAGGLLSFRFGVLRILLLGALLSAATNLLFMLMASSGNSMAMLYAVIGADNLSAGLASAAFVAFLSALTNIRFTAVQYAIFSSLMTLLPKVMGGYSGSMVENMGYPGFFLTTALLGIPVILLILLASRHLDMEAPGRVKSGTGSSQKAG